jgi:hypothetical protein
MLVIRRILQTCSLKYPPPRSESRPGQTGRSHRGASLWSFVEAGEMRRRHGVRQPEGSLSDDALASGRILADSCGIAVASGSKAGFP